jgi:polyferredoxin/plastocyanin
MSSRWVLVFFLGLAGLALVVPVPMRAAQTAERHLTVEARNFAFDPGVITVNQGDRVVMELESVDVTHGVYIDGYGVEAVSEPGHIARLEFVADRVGKFKYRCSMACGTLHPFMLGELIVQPNLPYGRGVAAALLAVLGSVVAVGRRGRAGASEAPARRRIELTDFRPLKRLLQWRGFQPLLMLATLLGFVLAVLTGLFGTPVGSSNFAIVFVWIVWFALLKIVLIPLAGRSWCTACPIPAPGEWLQRRGIVVRRGGKPWSLGLRWPRKLSNAWLQNASLLAMTIFSPLILTIPLVSGLVLLGLILLAVALSLVFERRAFCRYVCPVGGFVGLYSTVAPVELRVKDREVCHRHREKDCYLGNEAGHGCPWLVRPWSVERNNHCGLCTECLKTCPKDNVAVNLRPFGSDLFVQKGRGLDEAFTSLIMLTSVVLYSAVFLGPWGWLKDWAGTTRLSGRASYAAAFLGINLLLIPGLLWVVTALGRRLGKLGHLTSRSLFVGHAYALVPLGLSLWIAFSLSFLLVNGSYAVSVLSDPFGWGWDLFGTGSLGWVPLLPRLLPYLQVGSVVAGAVLSTFTAYRIVRQETGDERHATRGLIPVTGFVVLVSVAFLRLYLG